MRPQSIAPVLALSSIACAGAIPEPRAAPQPENAFVDVPYPPPAVHVETVPRRPDPRAVWIDGQWTWDGARWTWTAGGWVIPPPGGRLARWTVRWLPDGHMQFAPASWRDAAGRELPPARLVMPAAGEASAEQAAACR